MAVRVVFYLTPEEAAQIKRAVDKCNEVPGARVKRSHLIRSAALKRAAEILGLPLGTEPEEEETP